MKWTALQISQEYRTVYFVYDDNMNTAHSKHDYILWSSP